MAERSREMISDATRVLSVWKAMAMMSHISLECSRKSSGKPFAGRSIVISGGTRQFGLVLGHILARAHALDALLHFAHAGQIIVQLDSCRWR